MAVLASIATGNATTASTWGIVNATAYNNSESTTTALTTSYQLSSTFSAGAITISHIGIKLSVRTGTTGTISVCLDNAGADVAGTTVTINTADLPVAATADVNGGWHFFKLATPVTLAAAAHSVKVKTSTASMISLFSTATTNWARALITTTTQAPVAGDDLIISGEYTGAGTSNSFVVTGNSTAATDIGNATTSLVTPAIAICNKGSFVFGVAASTNYILKVSGNVIVYSGGTFSCGTSASSLPTTSSIDFYFDCVANVDFGLTVRNLGTFNTGGSPRTAGKVYVSCKLSSDGAVNATSLTVDTDTGWLTGDAIAVASTARTAANCEAGTLNGAAGASSLTVNGFAGTGGGLAFVHSGTNPTQAEVILLTRNVLIRGTSATLQAFIDIKPTAIVDLSWTEFKWLGSGTTNKRGIDVATTTGSFSANYCSFRNFLVTSSVGLNFTGISGNGYTITNNTFWNINVFNIANVATSATWTITENIFMLTPNSTAVYLLDTGGNFSNNTMVGSASHGLTTSDLSVLGTFANNTAHSNSSQGFELNLGIGTCSNFITWRNGGAGVRVSGAIDIVYENFISFGNQTSIVLNLYGKVTFNNGVFSGDSSFASNGLGWSSVGVCYGISYFNSCTFGVVSGIKTAHTTADIIFQTYSGSQMYLNNCLLASTEISQQALMADNCFVSSQKHDQTAGNHKTLKRNGTITLETVNPYGGSQHMRLTPLSASAKLNTLAPLGFQYAALSGQTVTANAYIFKSATYNGNQPRMLVKRNDAIGIMTDTVLATYSAGTGSYNLLSGTTIAFTDNGVCEIYFDCDGTLGSVDIDSLT